jgi:hypothetical protein
MPNRFSFLLISLPVMATRSSGQPGVIFQPFVNDPGADKIFLSELEKKYKKDFGELYGVNKKYIGELYLERYELIKEKFPGKVIERRI